MKVIKNKLLICFVFIICLLPTTKARAVSKATPINVKWTCKEANCQKEKHLVSIMVEPIGNAPIGDDSYEIRGDGSIDFAPEFDKAGKYEYLIYQENKDIKDGKTELIYDKTVYHLVYVVQEGAKGLEITAYAYDKDKYDKDPNNTGKSGDINFPNKDNSKTPKEPGNQGDKDDHKKPDSEDDGNDSNKKPDGEDDGNDDHKKPDGENGGKDNHKTPDQDGKDKKTKDPKDNKSSKDNVKTGVESLGGLCIILLSATGTIFATRQKNK